MAFSASKANATNGEYLLSRPLVAIGTTAECSPALPKTCLAGRVLRRHIGFVEPAATIIFSDGGVVTTTDVRRLLHDRVGPIDWLQFSLGVQRGDHTIPWTGLTSAGEVVEGRLLLHATVRETHVTVSAEVEIGPEVQIRTATDGRRDLLHQIALRARALIRRIREEPTCGPTDIAASLVALVELADEDEYPV